MKASDLDNPCRRNAVKRSREMGQEDSDMESRGEGHGKLHVCMLMRMVL